MSNAIYEQYRENHDVSVFKHGNKAFPVHFHMNVEVFLMTKGKCKVSVNGTEYTVSDGCVAFFTSYDLHGYSCEYQKSSDGKITPCLCEDERVVLIAPKYLTNFLNKTARLQTNCPVVKNPELCAALTEIANRILSKSDASDDFKQAGVDLFLSLIYENFDFVATTRKNDHSLIREILNYILLHYRENVNVNSVAKCLGYTREHISRTFHAYFNESLPRYVNALRLDHVKRRLKTDATAKISEIIYEAGFGSVQTFYRVKKQLASDANT